MRRIAINPAGLFDPRQHGFSHAMRHDGGSTLELAGQVSTDAQGLLVAPDDLKGQTRQALGNLKTVLAAVSAGPENVVRLRTYVVDHSPDKLEPVIGEILAFYDGIAPAPNTLIGVQALALPGFLVEIEATAILPTQR